MSPTADTLTNEPSGGDAPPAEAEAAGADASAAQFVIPPRLTIAGRHPAWAVMALAAAAVYMSGPGQSYSVAAFIDPMLADMHIGRTQYSTAYLVATLLGGLTLPYLGKLLDRLGARIMLPAIAVLLGLACIWMGMIQHVTGLYVGFTLIRCLGQGSLTLISSWMVGEWFEKRRGLAMGLVGLGGTLSVMTMPQLNDMLIDAIGWRSTWWVLAIAVWAILIVPGILLVRDRPEELGLGPDWSYRTHPGQDEDAANPGIVSTHTPREPVPSASVQTAHVSYQTPPKAEPSHHPAIASSESWTVGEALRTSAFWKLIAVIATTSMVGTGLIFHQVSLLGEMGISRGNALGLIGVQAIVGTVTSVVAGYLTDRMQARYLLATSMILLTLAMALLIGEPSSAWVIVYSCLLGAQGGIIRSTGMVVWINYYGRVHQGAVRGVSMSVMVIAAAFGPLPFALAKDYAGSYQLALQGLLFMPVLAAIAVLSARIPAKPASQD